MKRANFVSIQNSSSTFCNGQVPSPIRTGYERVIGRRNSDLFCATARKAGKVTRITPRSIEITHDDGEVRCVQLGRRYGNVAGMTIPHQIDTHLKEGDRVKHGDTIAFNSRFFQMDRLVPNQGIYKQGALLHIALMEIPETIEDSSMVSEHGAKLLGTQVTEHRDLVVSFDEAVHNLVSIGDHVDTDSILCTIEDAITAATGLFDEHTVDSLNTLEANSPKAKMVGTVESVEMFYNGDLDDLSPSLQSIARDCDMHRKRLARDLREQPTTGRLNDSINIGGNTLLPNQAVIRIWVTMDVNIGIGDKAVFANQMKSVIGGILKGENRGEDGKALDGIFSYASFSKRIVAGPDLILTTITLLGAATKKAVEAYDTPE